MEKSKACPQVLKMLKDCGKIVDNQKSPLICHKSFFYDRVV